MYCVVLREPGGRILIGSAGYVGPPSADGTVEIGYGIVADRRVPSLEPSVGVLRKCGFQLIDERSAPDVIRFELTRTAYEATAAER
jgi:RimJ/RimL family protein N-acetyltransferase